MCENNELKLEGSCLWKGCDSWYHITGRVITYHSTLFWL
jgi:hypothetical protein